MATKFPPCGCFMHRVFLGLVAPYNDLCPTLCGTGLNIINTSDGFTVDGWYLQVDASNLVYMESGVITETVECSSGLADYGHASGTNGGYEAPHIFNTDSLSWTPMIEVTISDKGGFDYQFGVFTTTQTLPYGVLDTITVQYSTDGGSSWIDGGTSNQFNNPTTFDFNTGTDTFIYRTIVTLDNGCQFFNPAPVSGSASYCIDYVTIDSSQTGGAAFDLLGTINGVTPLDDLPVFQPLIMATLAEPYAPPLGTPVNGAFGGLGFQEGSGISGGFYMQVLRPSTASTTASVATILDAGGTPIDATPTGTNCEAKTYYGSFTPNDFTQLYVDGLILAGTQISFPEVQTPALNDQTEFLSRMEERGLRDPAMTVVFTGVAPLDYSVTIRTALPIESVVFDEVGVGQIIVNLTEI